MTSQLKATSIQPNAPQTGSNVAELMVYGYIREINNLPTAQYEVPTDILKLSLQYFKNKSDSFDKSLVSFGCSLSDTKTVHATGKCQIIGTTPIKYTEHHRYQWIIKIDKMRGDGHSLAVGISQNKEKRPLYGMHYLFHEDGQQTLKRGRFSSRSSCSFKEGDTILIDVDFTSKTLKCMVKNPGFSKKAEFNNVIKLILGDMEQHYNDWDVVWDDDEYYVPIEYYLAIIISEQKEDSYRYTDDWYNDDSCSVSVSIKSFLWFDDNEEVSTRYHGECIFFLEEKHYGFIAMDNSPNVFVHESEVNRGTLEKGDEVSFGIKLDGSGRLIAINVTTV